MNSVKAEIFKAGDMSLNFVSPTSWTCIILLMLCVHMFQELRDMFLALCVHMCQELCNLFKKCHLLQVLDKDYRCRWCIIL